jgi:hypothetical protein
VAEKAYGYTLWKRRPGNLLGDKQMASASWYFDLADREAMTAALDALIGRYGKGDFERTAYWLQVTDPVTGETVRAVEPLESSGGNGAAPALDLQSVSDEALIRELARRLAQH